MAIFKKKSAHRKKARDPEVTALLLEAYHQNEIATNKVVAIFSLFFVFLPFLNTFTLSVEHSTGLAFANQYIFFPLGMVTIIVFFHAVAFKFDAPWLKHMLLVNLVLLTATVYFVFTTMTFYFMFIPIFVATRYFDGVLIHRVSLSVIVLFFIGSILNIVLEPTTEIIQVFHDAVAYNCWSHPYRILIYFIMPSTVILIFCFVYAGNFTKTGHLMMRRQAESAGQLVKVETEMVMAAKIQKSVLPDNHFITPNEAFEISAMQKTAKDVGGDFYSYFMTDENTLAVLIADVSDKGVPAALFMMSAKKAIDIVMHIHKDLKSAVETLNAIICRDNSSDMFLTLWLGVIDIRTGWGKYINAGHLPPIIRDATGHIRLLENDPDPFLGTFPEHTPKVHPFRLHPGDTLILYTDGITDAVNPDGAFFERSGLENTIQNAPLNAPSLTKGIAEALSEFCDDAEQFDDITLLTLTCHQLMTPLCRNLTLITAPETPRAIADAVNEILAEVQCPEDPRRDLDLIIDEIGTNICDYAYPERQGAIWVDIQATANAIQMTFRDNGTPFNPLNTADPEFEGDPLIGGLGLYLVKQKADRLDYTYTSGENRLTVTKLWTF